MQLPSAPSVRTLICVWFILMMLSAGTLFSGRVAIDESIGLMWVTALLTVTFFKTKLILNYFLDLKTATGSWNMLFSSLIFLLLIILLGLYSVSML